LNTWLSGWPIRLFIIVLTAWGLAVIVPDCTRPFKPLGSIGMTADNNGRIISVDPGGPADRKGVIPAHGSTAGDYIDLQTSDVRNVGEKRTLKDGLIEVFGGLGGMQYLRIGQPVELRLIEPNGKHVLVTITAAEEDLTVADDIVLELDQVLGIGFILLAAFLVWNYPRRSTLGFFLFSIWFNPGQYFTFYAWLPANVVVYQEALQAIFEAAGIAGFLQFALRFPTDRAENWRASVERGLPYLFVVLATLGLLSFGSEFGHRSELLTRVAYGAAYAVYPLVAFAFATKLRVLSNADRLRLWWVIAGCIPGLFFFIVADSIESTSMWQRLWDTLHWQPPEIWLNLAYMVNALVAVSVAYAVIRERVLPIAFLINRGLVLSIVWVTVTMAVEALLIVTHYLLDYNHLLSSILTALVIIIAAPLLERFQEWLNAYIDHLFFRDFHDAEERLAQLATTLPAASSVEAIEKQLLDAPCAAFGTVSAALFHLQDNGSFALAPNAQGWPATAATSFSVDDPLVLRFREFPKPLRLNALLRKNGDLPQGAAFPAIVIPLAVDRNVDAFVMYGGHEAGTDLSPDEIATLVRLADAAAMARDHVRSISLGQQLEAAQRRLAALVSPPRLAT
jgi:hypothetical protein